MKYELINMALHETRTLNDGTHILKVLGGWIYTTFHTNWIQMQGEMASFLIPSSVFVPIDRH